MTRTIDLATYVPVGIVVPCEARWFRDGRVRPAEVIISTTVPVEGGWCWNITLDADPYRRGRQPGSPHRDPGPAPHLSSAALSDHGPEDRREYASHRYPRDPFTLDFESYTETRNLAPEGMMPQYEVVATDVARLLLACKKRVEVCWPRFAREYDLVVPTF